MAYPSSRRLGEIRVPRVGLLVMPLLAVAAAAVDPPAYDPLVLPATESRLVHDLTVEDARRGRAIPVRVHLPAGKEAAPVVLFSHGLGGSREGCAYLGEHWSARGYVVVFLQHPGSDTSVWRGKPLRQRQAAMDSAANGENFLLRVRDVGAVLDQLAAWHGTDGHALAGRLDLSRVGMSGHSFGAVTTQAVSGQAFGPLGPVFTDSRIRAAVILSPSCPRSGDPQTAFGRVRVPWLLMTGTRDLSPIGDVDMASRLGVFPCLPPGDKCEVVLHDGQHSAFTDRGLPGDHGSRNPNHHRVILALSTAFWDAFLRDDAEAAAWLRGPSVRSVLESEDRWQCK